MFDTIIPVLVGALIAAMPNIIATYIDLKKNRRQQKHDLNLRYFDLYSKIRFEAIEEYAHALTCFIAGDFTDDRSTYWRHYMRLYERASLFVSEETRRLMIDAFGTLVPASYVDDISYTDIRYAAQSVAYNALLSALNRELYTCLPPEQNEVACNAKSAANHELEPDPKKGPVWASIKSCARAANPFRNRQGNTNTNESKKKSQ